MSETKRITKQKAVEILEACEHVFGAGFYFVAMCSEYDDECDIEVRGPKAKYTVAEGVPDEVAVLFLRAPDMLRAAALGRWPGGGA